MLFRAKSDVLKPIENFKKTFQWIIFGTILLVVVLSIDRIRKSMVPVAELIEGVDRIDRKDFSQDIHISSNDEFEVLAEAFNQMAGRARTRASKPSQPELKSTARCYRLWIATRS